MMEEFLQVRDGVKLHTFIYLPEASDWGEGPYPAIISRIPYGIGPAGVLPGSDGGGAAIKTWQDITEHGYACVFQDTRGRYASEGMDTLFYNEAEDGYDTIEWVAAQSWCNGNVGIAGSSAGGITSYLAGALNPPHLKAVFAQAGSGDLLNDFTLEGQALELETMLVWLTGQGLQGLSASHVAALGLSDAEYAATRAQALLIRTDLVTHLSNPVDSSWWMYLPLMGYPATSVLEPYWDVTLTHPSQDAFRDHYNTKDKISVPTLHATTWYDCFLRGNLEAFLEVQARVGNQMLFILPGGHYNVYNPAMWPYDPFFRWFDYWLKGISNGIMDEPPILYFHRGAEEWRYLAEWPPSHVRSQKFYMHANGTLNNRRPANDEGVITYQYDPRDPVQTLGGRNLILPPGPFDQRPVEPPYRNDVLIYTSAVLEDDLELAGKIKVVLHASSDSPDTDFTAKVVDVHPDGSAMLVLDGITRARFRESPRYEVFMVPGSIYKFTIDLGDIHHVFREGHRIQVDISSSNFPRRDRNTNSGNPLYTDPDDAIAIATNTIYHDRRHPSYALLPLLPPKPTVFEGNVRIKTSEGKYAGAAELFTLGKAVYLHFNDSWIKWNTKKNWRTRRVEHYKCQGDLGHLSVLINNNRRASFDALATGQGVHFKGEAKY